MKTYNYYNLLHPLCPVGVLGELALHEHLPAPASYACVGYLVHIVIDIRYGAAQELRGLLRVDIFLRRVPRAFCLKQLHHLLRYHPRLSPCQRLTRCC